MKNYSINKKLMNIANNAYKTVPMYVRKAWELGGTIQVLKEEDWTKLPLIDKNSIVNDESAAIAPECIPLYLKHELINMRTSGSTGKYMDIYWKKVNT